MINMMSVFFKISYFKAIDAIKIKRNDTITNSYVRSLVCTSKRVNFLLLLLGVLVLVLNSCIDPNPHLTAIHSINTSEGVGALEKVKDQSLISEVARLANNTQIRQAAVEMLSDQHYILYVVQTANDSVTQYHALKKLKDQSLLEKIALNIEGVYDLDIRQSATKLIMDKKILLRIAAEADNIAAYKKKSNNGMNLFTLDTTISNIAIKNIGWPELIEMRRQINKLGGFKDGAKLFYPVIFMLNESCILERFGKIASIELFWTMDDARYAADYSSSYRPNNFGPITRKSRTNIHCIVKFNKSNFSISKEWKKEFPKSIGSLEDIIARVCALDILEPIFKELSDSVLIAIVNKNYSLGVDTTAINQLKEQASLYKIATMNTFHDRSLASFDEPLYRYPSVKEVCETCTEKLTDQYLLLKLVISSKNLDVRKIAVSRLTYEPYLIGLALKETISDLRNLAVENKYLKDQSVLTKVALKDSVYWIREGAIDKLSNQSTLFNIAIKDNSPSIRVRATRCLTDQALVSIIAKNGVDLDTRIEAINKLKDKSLLKNIISNDNYLSIREKAKSQLEFLVRLDKNGQ